MGRTLPLAMPLAARAEDRVATTGISWYIWCSVIAVTSAIVGVHWDISWHESIGRDTFWSPPHMGIYLCGVLAGVSSAYLILSATFGSLAGAKETSIRLWGFRGPVGAFISAWGGVAMLVSAPFDDWWHNAYGLDVKIVSPPHVLLGIGILAIRLGTLILILGEMNRAQGALREKFEWLFLYVGSLFVMGLLILTMEHTIRSFMHSARFYLLVSLAAPVWFTGISRASGRRWAATTMAAIYTGYMVALVWILPLFPAQPKLGPVYQKVTHFIPPEFPLLLIAPALALDLLRSRIARWTAWKQAALAGATFLATFVAVQWPFADFLMSPPARNWFFGAHYFGYFVEPTSPYFRNQFVRFESTPMEFAARLAFALGAAILSCRIGLAWGDWMRRIRR